MKIENDCNFSELILWTFGNNSKNKPERRHMGKFVKNRSYKLINPNIGFLYLLRSNYCIRY